MAQINGTLTSKKESIISANRIRIARDASDVVKSHIQSRSVLIAIE